MYMAADRRTDWSKRSYPRHVNASEDMVRERKKVVHSVTNNIVGSSLVVVMFNCTTKGWLSQMVGPQ